MSGHSCMQTIIVNKKLFNRSVPYKPDCFVKHLIKPFTELVWRPDNLLSMPDIKLVSCVYFYQAWNSGFI